MPKLQRIRRSNGSYVFSINIPLEIVNEMEWKKGQELFVEIQKVRVGKSILIFEKEDKNNDTEI